ncbi:MAG: TRAP transporter large permease subunit [Betaproteobacteria bacterium]|nr:TRAP transporter large permease subunit [Betaproteobacteria bacterium]
MSDSLQKMGVPEGDLDAETRQRVESLIKEEEGDTSSYRGVLAVALTLVAVGMSLFHLYSAYAIVPAQIMRMTHVVMVLAFIFITFPIAARYKNRLMWWDVVFAGLAIAALVYAIRGGDNFTDRNTFPLPMDVAFGGILILLILEAVRRTNGLVLLSVTIAFLSYALFGDSLPAPWTHKGYDLSRLVGFMYMTLEGIFGVAVDVSSSLIILFTIFGAFLQFSGAGKFFIDFSFSAMGGKTSSVGRTVVLSSFLMGGPSGSGVATTVTVGSVAHSMLTKAGIAEFLKISYLDVLLMATIPTFLFYLGLFVMVQIDARKYNMSGQTLPGVESAWVLTKKYWFHFFSLISIVLFMLMGFSPIMSVFWATVASLVTSFLRRDSAMIPYEVLTGRAPFWKGLYQSRLTEALSNGFTQVLSIAATCAGAGLIVGVVVLTGLGLKFSAIVIEYAGGSLFLTALFTALIVWIVGLAVPVTASYIICAVVAAPALIKLGVPEFAAHMFIFYYAVLSEVSPPTALAPFAAAAICKGNPYRTTFQSWKYVAPAILVPFIFVLDPAGVALLLMGSTKALAKANWADIAWITFTASVGIIALAGGLQNWFMLKTNLMERWLLIGAGLALTYPSATTDIAGFIGFGVVLASQLFRRSRGPHGQSPGMT